MQFLEENRDLLNEENYDWLPDRMAHTCCGLHRLCEIIDVPRLREYLGTQ